MVNITHNNADPIYNNPKDWIRYGITEDAVFIFAGEWYNDKKLNYDVKIFDIHFIFNKSVSRCMAHIGNVNQLNKW